MADGAADGNLVKNNNMQYTSAASDATSQSARWARYLIESKRELNLTQAQQYRDAILEQYKNPAQLAAFAVGGGYIRSANGTRVPVWRMLVNPGIIRVNDLFADGAVFSNTIDGRQSFRIVALDYDHNRRSMRVTPDTQNEARLDVVLHRGGIMGIGQMIDRGE
jgi:hypothetical protein